MFAQGKGTNALSTEIGLAANVQIQGELYLWLVILILFLMVSTMFLYYYHKYKEAISTKKDDNKVLRDRLISPKRFVKTGLKCKGYEHTGQAHVESSFRHPQSAEAVLQCGRYRFPECVPKEVQRVTDPLQLPMCMECLNRVGLNQFYHFCLKCSEWICDQCSVTHIGKVSCKAKYSSVCRHICSECSERKCGRRDCNWPECSIDEQYHVCAQCVVKAIDLRHPATWFNVVSKTHSVDSETRGYDTQSLASARIFLWIHLGCGWVLTMKRFLVDGSSLNQWCRFEHNYNLARRAAETPRMLALLYAAILTFEAVTVDEQRISEFFAHSWEETLVPHDRLLWYNLLTLKRHTKIEDSINLAPNVHTDGSSVLEKFVALAKHCEYVLTNYEMRTLNAEKWHGSPLRPSISPQSDWLNQNQVPVDDTQHIQGQSTDEAATSSRPLTGAVTILVNAAYEYLPQISFFLILAIALSIAMLSEAQVSVPKQIAKS